MSYEVLARKWRPQRFGEVVGQQHVTTTLRNAIANQRVAHAYVFVGPRGVGKTSIARIFAKALQCKAGKGSDPCDTCDSCREIREGRCLDVIEIDGASNNGVDQVRDLRDNARYAPARGPYKIYIIDEVHMLSIGAFNALLKTLEEPPAHVKFLFATTEVQKIPATILSRCQRFDLRRISTPDISNHLGELAKKEGVEIDTDALLAIARGAEGGLRDAESALDQLIAFRGRSISESDVLSVFGLVSRRALDEIARAVLGGDIPALLKQVAELDEAGKDLQRLSSELLEYFRNLLVVVTAGNQPPADLTSTQFNDLKTIAGGATFARLMAVTDILLELQAQFRFSLSRRTLLELMLIRCARASTAVTLDEVLDRLSKVRASLGAGDAAAAAPAPQSNRPAAPAPAPESKPVPVSRSNGNAQELATLRADWRAFVNEVRALAPLAGGCLVDAKPVSLDDAHLVLGFDPEFASHLQKVRMPRHIAALQKVLQQRLGRVVALDLKVLSADEAVDLPSDHRVTPDEAPQPAVQTVNREGAPRSRQAWMEEPAVKRTLEAFQGDIVDIRE